jgi:hypothetical protein
MLINNVKQNGFIFKTVACRNRSGLKENQMESFQNWRKLCVLPQSEYDETLFFWVVMMEVQSIETKT